MSDYIFVMKDGIIVESGLSNDVFDYPKEKYTKKLLSAALRYATDRDTDLQLAQKINLPGIKIDPKKENAWLEIMKKILKKKFIN